MSTDAIPMELFRLGDIMITPGALKVLSEDDVGDALARHHSGDWGDLAAADTAANNTAMIEGSRLLSSYRSATGTRFWIITEADRRTTHVLLPDEY